MHLVRLQETPSLATSNIVQVLKPRVKIITKEKNWRGTYKINPTEGQTKAKPEPERQTLNPVALSGVLAHGCMIWSWMGLGSPNSMALSVAIHIAYLVLRKQMDSVSVGPSWSIYWVPCQQKLHSKALSWKQTKMLTLHFEAFKILTGNKIIWNV